MNELEKTSKICIWCGKVYWGSNASKFCSDDCRLSLSYTKETARQKGDDSTIEVLCMKHKQMLNRQREEARKHREVELVHTSSSSAQYRWVVKYNGLP